MNPGLIFYRCPYILVLLLLLGMLAPVVRGQASLHRVGPPGGTVTDLAVTATGPHVVYAAWGDPSTDPRLFRADDVHQMGRYVGAHGSDVSVHPTQHELVFSGSSRSTDGGQTWEEMPGVREVLAFHLLQPDTLWGRGEEELLLSHDAGVSWAPLSDVDLLELAVGGAEATILYGRTETSLLQSHDGGGGWSAIAFPSGAPLSLAADPADAQRVYAGGTDGLYGSADGGGTWELLLPDLQVIGLVIHPEHADRLYVVAGPAANRAAVYASEDGGQTWQLRNEGIRGGVRTLLIDPRLPGRLYAGTWLWGTFVSEDGGGSWAGVGATPGPLGPDFHFYSASKRPLTLDPAQADRAFVHPYQQGTQLTHDGGKGWDVIDYGHFGDQRFALQVHDLAVVPSAPDRIYATVRGTTPHMYTLRALLRSDDGGDTWVVQDSLSVTQQYFGLIALHQVDNSILAVNAGHLWADLWLTEDAGESWRTTSQLGISVDMSFVASRPMMLITSTRGANFRNEVWRSEDLGHTWTEIADGRFTGRLHVVEAEPPVLYVAPERGSNIPPATAYRTSLDEIAWDPIHLSPFVSGENVRVHHVVSAPDDPERLYAALSTGLYTSGDAGTSWEQLFKQPMYYLVPDPHVPGRLWAASYFEGVYRIEGLPVSTEMTPPAVTSLTMSAPYPNPSRGEVNVTLAAPVGSEVTVTVYDLLGRPVRSLAVPAVGGGEQLEVQWDGRDEAGRVAPAGVYVITLSTAGERVSRTVLRL